MSTETDPKKIVTYTQNECRAKAAAKLVEAQTYLNDDCPKSTELALSAAQFWATLALSAPSPSIDVRIDAEPSGQTIPGVTLFSASDPEPDVNPGEILVDPSGGVLPYLLRLDGHKWLWCDSLAHAEAMGFDDAGSWSEAMSIGLIRVRRATEREQIEFRSGNGGASLDLVKRLLGTLAGLASDSGHEHIARWLTHCDQHAHLSFFSWEWPEPVPAAPMPPLGESRQTIPPGVLTDLVHAPGCVIHYGSSPVVVTTADDDSVKFSAPVHWSLAAKNDRPLGDMLTVRVENPQPDLERLTGATLTRLRDQIQATITKRAQTDAKAAGERWRAGTGGGIPDYHRGGAEQWREG